MTRSYARDRFGNGSDLPDTVLRGSGPPTSRPSHYPHFFSHSMKVSQSASPTCTFWDSSTFTARPLINILISMCRRTIREWELAGRFSQPWRRKLELLQVLQAHHGGAGEQPLGSWPLYASFGFDNGEYEPDAGRLLFREKKL